MADFQIERCDAKLPLGLDRLDPKLHGRRKRRFRADPNDQVLACDAVILEPQLLDDRDRVLLKGVVDAAVISEDERRGYRGVWGCGGQWRRHR